jgi:hypothetical protein
MKPFILISKLNYLKKIIN